MNVRRFLPLCGGIVSICLHGVASEAVVMERGADHRVLQYATYQTNGFGRIITNLHSSIELQTGLHYKGTNEDWLESDATFEVVANALEGTRTGHKVSLSGNINTSGGVTLVTPDAKEFRSHIVGLSYYDKASGNSVLLAEVKDSYVQLSADNVALYPDAFTDYKADVRYTYTKSGLEQDVIVRESLPSPAEFSLDPATTYLELLTEFLAPPAPEPLALTSEGTLNVTNNDCVLDFGAMKIMHGKAFDQGDPERATKVIKRWQKLGERDFLIEQVQYSAIRGFLDSLPQRPGASNQKVASKIKRTASAKRTLPIKKEAKVFGRTIKKVATSANEEKGLVLDYVILSGSANYTFRSDTTYYISGTVNLTGNTIVEGGTIIKFAKTNNAKITVEGIETRTAPYRPAIFTAKDDNTVGENISGSTGSPSGYYGVAGIETTLNSGYFLKNLRFRYFTNAVYCESQGYYSYEDLQIVNCLKGISQAGGDASVGNCLFYNVQTNFVGYANAVRCENITVHLANSLSVTNGGTGSIYLTNSLLIGVTNSGQFSTNFDSVTVLASGDVPSVFQTVGNGSHYLADGSAYRDIGSTNINALLAAKLKKKTTYPPNVITTDNLLRDSMLYPSVDRDTGTPDLGYHYDPIDYASGSLTVPSTNSSLSIKNGCVLGLYASLILEEGTTFSSQGTPTNLNQIIASDTVQEQATTNWAALSGVTLGANGIIGPPAAPVVNVNCEFTGFSRVKSGAHINVSSGQFALQNCQLLAGTLGVGGAAGCSASDTTWGWTNNVFERMTFNIFNADYTVTVKSFNNTFWNCSLTFFDAGSAYDYTFKDNYFHSCDIDQRDTIYEGAYVTSDYNVFYHPPVLTALTPVGAHDKNTLTDSNSLVSGPLGYYYHRITNRLDNAGSRTAADAGLYHYTSAADQTKETNSTVDIGFHYVALTNGGTSVYVEDAIPTGGGQIVSNDQWNWISGSPTPFSGSLAHKSDSVAGLHYHQFTNATTTQRIGVGASMICYVHIPNGTNLPTALMLQWICNDASTNYHRAYWGSDSIGWRPGVYMGPIPPTNTWVRLEVPAHLVNLEGRTVNGMGFVLYDGSATWDYAGIVESYSTPIDFDRDGLVDYLEDTNGNGSVNSGETHWQDAADAGLKVIITQPKANSVLP